jgi:hypothetical protein
MLLRSRLQWGFPCAAALCAALIAWAEWPPGQVLEAKLFKRVGERGSVELVTGDTLAPGNELYMTLKTRRALHVYVLSEDAAGERWVIFPCRNWGRSPRLAADLQHRLPGDDGFWPVRSVTPREHLVVIASARSIDLLDAVFMTGENPEPCAAPVGLEASRLIDDLVEPSGSPFKSLWKVRDREPEAWTSTFDLKGAGSHG